MAKYPRIGRLTIAGEEYPAVINGKVLTQLEDKGITIEGALATDGTRWHNLFLLITLAINAGIRLTGSTAQPVTEDEIADAVDLSELTSITDQIAVLLGHKSRTVEAELPKN